MTTELSIPSQRKFNWPAVLEIGIPLIGLVLLIVVTAICERIKDGSSDFLTPVNLLNILHNQAPVGIVAIGMTLVIISGGIDLSVGSMVGMVGILGMWIMMYTHGSPTKIALAGLPIMILTGLLAGLLNGVLIAKGRIAPFIATLGGLAAYRSIAETVANSGTLTLPNSWLETIGEHGIRIPFLYFRDQPLELHYASLLFFISAIAAAVVLNRTRYGRYVFAIGGNERAAAYSAIRVDRVKILTYSIAGFFCGLSAIVFAARQHSVASSDAGKLYELDAIAAVVIGGTRLSGGAGSVFGTVIGVLILGVIENMLNFLDVPPTLQGLVKGVIIVAAAMVQRMGRRS